jgi:caffeoyl-CoA O-methyltransferase
MSPKTLSLTDTLASYLVDVTLREAPILRALRETTQSLPGAGMQIAPEQGQFMRLLVQLVGAKRALEVGVYTGYSSTCVALELPSNGLLVACDINLETSAIAQRYWKVAGVSEKVRLEIGPAEQTLTRLVNDGESGTFDFAFIDADKESYDTYYELCLQLIRVGGLIAIDNALWSGRVADAKCMDSDTVAIRNLNAKVAADKRVSSSLVPIGDGLLLVRKSQPTGS